MRVEKGFFDVFARAKRSGMRESATVPFFVFDCDDEQSALDAVLDVAERTVQNLALQSVEIDERMSETIYRVVANYEMNSEETSGGGAEDGREPKFSFATTGATMHRNYSLGTMAFGDVAPDYGGAIEVDNEGNIAGVDVTMSSMRFSEVHNFSDTRITTAYKKKIALLTGKVNSGAFRGYAAGEVLFLGASGSRNGDDSDDLWEITFDFAVSENRSNFEVGGISITKKRGWDYLWLRYRDVPASDNSAMGKEVVGAYVEKVYEDGDFGGLSI